MCKPQIRYLDVKGDGPCDFSISSHTDACAAFWLGKTFKQRTGNVLRRWADKIEGRKTFTIAAVVPSQITYEDALDGLAFSLTAGRKYLNDLWRDRVHGSADDKPAFIMPTKELTR